MEPTLDKYVLVSFKADDGIVHIEKKNIPLIGVLYERYDLYRKSKYKHQQIVIPLLKGTLKEEIILVDNALNVRPDHFSIFYNELQQDQRNKLLKSSMLFYNDSKKVGLHVPEITKRILSICLSKDVYKNVMKFFSNKDKDDLIFHCREQLIENKSRIGIVKQPRAFDVRAYQEIDLQTLFVNGYFDSDTIKRPIPLQINDKIYKTYAYNFVSPYLEYRITEQLRNKNSSHYLIWIIDHKNPQATFAEPIQHSSPIIGCCFSKAKTNEEYVVTYSEDDIIFSTISMFEDYCDVKTVRIDTASKGKNVAAAYCNSNNQLIMGMYQGTDNVFINWTMNGIATLPAQWPFKIYGLLEKIVIKKNNLYEEEAFYIFGSCGQYNVQKWQDLGSVLWTSGGSTRITHLINIQHHCSWGEFFEKNNEVFMYNNYPSSFAAVENLEKQQQQLSVMQRLTQGLVNDFHFMPDDECHRKYSSSGEFILSNSLKKEFGMLYVKTEVLDSINHKRMLSIDTIYKNFFGVGFDDEETKLIFMHNNINNAEVSLWDEQDKKDMEWFEGHVLQDLGTVSLMVRLLKEIKKKNEIVLKKSDPIYTMLLDWAKMSPHTLAFMKKCFPLRVVKG